MSKAKKQNRRKNVVSVVAVAGVMALGATPLWAQQWGQSQQSGRQQSAQNETRSDALVTANTLKESPVVDAQNHKIGEMTNLFIDPQTGKIARADIEFSGEAFGKEKKHSVSWEQLSVKRQGDGFVVALDQSVIDRVQVANQRKPTGTQTQESGRQQQGERATYGSAAKAGQQSISADQMSAEQIRKVQQQLNKEGFHAGEVDGQWNSQTENAIKNFQGSKGIQATGQLDQQTLNELGLEADEFRQQSQPGKKTDAKPSQW